MVAVINSAAFCVVGGVGVFYRKWGAPCRGKEINFKEKRPFPFKVSPVTRKEMKK
jgi:hypothetical protein